MRRRSAALGLVMLTIVLAIVAVLVARSWNGLAARAVVARDRAGAPAAAPADLPNLGETRTRTDRHAEQLNEALQATSGVP